VKQQGSTVDSTRLRFDFSHSKPVSREELRKIEREVNDVIFRNLDAVHREMPYSEAIALGALAFFGDKYGERVRMLTIGDYSKELCGGTHVSNTGEIGFFRFLGEEGIAAGVRRVEAVTNASALAHAHEQEDVLIKSADLLKSAQTDVPDRIEKLLDENKRLLKEMEKLRSEVAAAAAGDLVSKARDVKGTKVLVEQVALEPAQLREFAEKLLDKLKSGVVVLGATSDGKGTLLAAVSKDLQGKIQAGAIIKEITAAVGGKGGGKADMAQGSAPDGAKVPAALQAALDLLSR
jgi:alanyl-tRNA synthetase